MGETIHSSDADQELQEERFTRAWRRWAIEQAIKSGAQGAYQIWNEANQLLAFVGLQDFPPEEV